MTFMFVAIMIMYASHQALALDLKGKTWIQLSEGFRQDYIIAIMQDLFLEEKKDCGQGEFVRLVGHDMRVCANKRGLTPTNIRHATEEYIYKHKELKEMSMLHIIMLSLNDLCKP